MNPQLSRLLDVAPALIAGAKGNPQAMQAFMQGFQDTKRLLEAQQMQEAQLAMQQQGQQDAQAQRELQNTRQANEDAFNHALKVLGIGANLGPMAAGADSPEQAASLVNGAVGMFSPQDQQALGPMAQQAISQAPAMITSRKKAQAKSWLESVEKRLKDSGFLEGNPDIPVPENLRSVFNGAEKVPWQTAQGVLELPVIGSLGKPKAADEPSMQSKELLGPDGKMHVYNFNPKTGEYTQAEGVSPIPPRAPTSVNALGTDDTDAVVESLLDGTLVPSQLSKRGNYNQIMAMARRRSLERTGKPYNASSAQTEYQAAQRFMAGMNSQQMQRFRGLANSVVNTIDEVKMRAQELQNSGVPLANRVKLAAYAQTQGNTPKGQLAAQYLAAVNILKEEFASLAQGGYAPTEAAWNLANQQINGDFGVKQLEAALSEVQRLINYRMQGFNDLTPYGVNPGNPVLGGGGAPTEPPPAGVVEEWVRGADGKLVRKQ